MLKPAQQKKLAVERVLREKRTVAEVAREFGVARKTIYSWVKRYKQSSPRVKEKAFDPRYPSERNHPRSVLPKVRYALIRLIISSPEWGCRKYCAELRDRSFKIGYVSVNTLLKKLGASTPEERLCFRRNWAGPGRLTSQMKFEVVSKVLEKDKPLTTIAREYGIARKTIYQWLGKYQKNTDKGLLGAEALKEEYVQGSNHPRAVDSEIKEQLFTTVVQRPELSIHQLANVVPVSVGTAWNILNERNLTHYAQRVEYADRVRAQTSAALPVQPVTGWLNRLKQVFEQFLPGRAPAPPPIFAPSLRDLPRFAPYYLFFLFILFGLFQWGRLLGNTTSTTQAIGWIFASVALSMGTVFFLYSLKYYFTLAVVLSFSREGPSTGSGLGGEDSTGRTSSISSTPKSASATGQAGRAGRSIGWLGRLFGISRYSTSEYSTSDVGDAFTSDVSVSGGLEPDLSKIKLERHPFISIHLPMYNEKRVAERILRACTAFDYSNYEIVVADDSTDETTSIVQGFAERWSAKLKSQSSKPQLKTQNLTPLIKVIHRDTREGFKGGALKEALKHTNPKAEFIVVFDADFVPYPDTLELFLKYFQANAGSLQRVKKQEIRNKKQWKYQDSNIAAIQGYQWPRKDQPEADQRGKHVSGYEQSNVAAIQGYQWHVLNKSENWITRGVRSEYAGSYVIERSGEELYGGLKQIAGSVYMIRRDLLDNFGWGTSLTEDFELTLRLYEAGYKVVYTPYIQAPSECVSTLKRLIRQRMRWAEGHSYNIRKKFFQLLFGRWADVENSKFKVPFDNTQDKQSSKLQLKIQNSKEQKRWIPSPLTLSEKLEFLYLCPYYLQAAFFLLGTISWLFSETIFRTPLPFWTAVWGWSLVLTNLLSLPLMNMVGLFLEEAEEKDFTGVSSFILLSYILVPFQAYASVKGFLEPEEGPWFRTPKTGMITDILTRGRFYRFIRGILPGRLQPAAAAAMAKWSHGYMVSHLTIKSLSHSLSFASANRQFSGFTIRRRHARWVGRAMVSFMLLVSTTLISLAPGIKVREVPVSVNSGILVSPVVSGLPDGGQVGKPSQPSDKRSFIPSLVQEVYAAEDEVEFRKADGRKDFRLDEELQLIFHFAEAIDEGLVSRLMSSLLNLFQARAYSSEAVNTHLFDYFGKELKVDLEVSKESDQEIVVKVPKSSNLRLGAYTIKTEFIRDGKTYFQEQDFTWGVLAINTNKSVYLPDETVKLSMAVLDDEGNMVCDAKLELRITNYELRINDTLTTEEGTIKVNSGCRKKEMILEPDYEAEYQLGEAGIYEMELTAETANGNYTISDSFEVRNPLAGSGQDLPFDIERKAPTRIYPPLEYPVTLTVKANEDFKGELIEAVPDGFSVKCQMSNVKCYFDESEQDIKKITWQVDWKKGETHELGYEFDAPDESPEFYMLGPIRLVDTRSGLSVFSEARQWQVAVDALIDISGNILAGCGGPFIGNPPCNGSTAAVSLRVNGGDESTTDCDDTTGYYLFSSVSVNAGDTVTVYLNTNSTPKANLVMVAGASNITGADLCEDAVVIRDEDGGTATIADMVDYDNDQNPGDMLYGAETSPSTTLDIEYEVVLHIWTGDTFAPGGNVTTGVDDGDLTIDDNAVFTGASTEYHTIGHSVKIRSGATLTAPPDGTIEVSGMWENDGTFTAGSSTVYFNQSFTQFIDGNLNGSSAFYKVTFSGGGTWYIVDPMKVSKANGTDTFEIQSGTVILGNGAGDNLEVNGKMVVGSSTGAATFQTYSSLSEGSTITIDINNNSSPADCLNCIIEVGTSTNTDPQGTFTLNKNATIRFNSYSSVQSGFSVLASGRLNINGSQDDTGTDTGTDNAALRETKICADEAWSLDGHNGKRVMMTSGFAIGRIYAITDTLVADNDCASNQHDSIVRSDTSSANDTNPTVTGGSCSGTGDCTITTSISLISANDEGIGRHIHNITDDDYYLIIDSTEGGTTDTIVITSGEPDTFTNMGSGDDIEITDSIRSGDTFSIIDFAYVTAQAGTSCNDSENGFITLAGDSETFIQYAEVCDLGAEVTDKRGIHTSGNIDNNDANEGVTIQYSHVHDMNRGFNSEAGKLSTRAVIEHNLFETSSAWLLDIRGKGMSIRNNRITGAGLDGVIMGGSDNYGSVFEGNYIHNNYQAGIEQWDGAGNNIVKDNVVFANGMGFYTQAGTGGEHIFYGNKVFSNVLRGWRHDGGANSLFVGNEVFAELVGHRIRNTSGAIMVANQFGVKGANTTTDIDYEDTTAASSITCYGCTLASSTEVPANDVAYPASYFASFKQDSAGATKIWGEYSFPDDIAETPNNEGSKQFNYSDNTYPDSFSPHVYAGDGTEDSSLAFAFSGGSLGGSSDYYLYRVACNNSSGCNDVSPSNDWDVFRDETDIGDATTGSQYTDSSTNVQFTVQDAGTDYSLGDTYSFFVWKNAADTSTQKSVTMMQTGDTLTVGTGETIELKGDSSNRTLVQKDSGATSYSLTVTGTIDANYYRITGTDASGLNLGTGATVTDLDNGVFDDSGGAGESDTYITVVASVLNGGAKIWTDMVFDEGTADSNVDYNITLSDIPTSCDFSWTLNSSGNIGGATNGEANDNETDADCGGVGYILWIDQGITSVWTFQRKTFYDATDDNYWRFYYDGSEIDIFYNQTPWTSSWTPIASLAEDAEDYSVWDDDTYVYIAYYDTWDIKVRRGTLNPTSISWGSEEIALNGLNAASTYKYSFISQDSSGHLWVIARYYNGTNYYMRAVRSTNAYDVSSWDTAHDLSSTSNTDTNNYGLIVPLSSQDMYAIWIRASTIEGRQWDNDAAGDEWDPDKTSNPDSIATGQSGMTANITATTDTSDNVHLVYVDSSNYVQYLKCSAVCSGSFGSSARLDGSAGNQFVTASVDTAEDDVYVIWIKSGNTYYNYYTTSWQGEAEVPNWTEGTGPSDLTSNYADDDRIFAVWTSGSASPYTSNWDYIIIPERLWLWFGVAPLIPLVLRRRRKAYAEARVR